MKIIKYTKLSGGKYKLQLEDNNSLILYEDVILNNNLLLIKEIDDLNKIKKENDEYEIYELAKKYINRKYVSKKELYKYLINKKYESELINKVIKDLEVKNILNEENYVKAYINDKINFTNDGPNKIKKDLLNNGIDEEIIDNNMEIDFNIVYGKLDKLIDKKILFIKNYSGNVLKQKLIMYFINLGYDRRMIEEILLNKNLINNDDGIKEYNKLYNKYKNKYNSFELENILRQKLYLKGFSYDEIKKSMD